MLNWGHMEAECPRCHKKFQSSGSPHAVCPDCLSKEFAAAAPMSTAEAKELRKEQRAADRRREARTKRMADDYNRGDMFNPNGKLYALLAFMIFLCCEFIFMIARDNTQFSSLAELSPSIRRSISFSVCLASAILVIKSSRRHRLVTIPLAFTMAMIGWFTPDLWVRNKEAANSEKTVAKQPQQQQEQTKDETYHLTQEDLEPLARLRKDEPRQTHFAIFINRMPLQERERDILRDAFSRLLRAEYTQAATRGSGVLYTVANSRADARVAGLVAGRFGQVIREENGVIEVVYDADKANMVCRYSPAVLSSPGNAGFIPANMRELSSVDPARVRAAALAFRDANTKAMRHDVQEGIAEVLGDPWEREPDTYSALVEALVVYSPPGDKRTIDYCLAYFNSQNTTSAVLSPLVIEELVRQAPDRMVQPVVEHWVEAPDEWGRYLSALGQRAESAVLKVLEKTDNLGTINNSLKFLRQYGTAAALPQLRAMQHHPDSTVRYSVEATLAAVTRRESN